MPGRMCYRSPSVNGWHRAKRQAHSANKLKLPFIEIMRFTALLHAPCAMRYANWYTLFLKNRAPCIWTSYKAVNHLFDGYDCSVGDHFEFVGC